MTQVLADDYAPWSNASFITIIRYSIANYMGLARSDIRKMYSKPTMRAKRLCEYVSE